MFWFWVILCIILDACIGTVYNNCDDYVTQFSDTYKVCKLLQSIDFTQTSLSSFNMNQTNYCGTNINNELRIICDDDTSGIIREFSIKSPDIFAALQDGIFNYSDNLGWPGNITIIDLSGQYPIYGFNFTSIYGLQYLQELRLSGNLNSTNNDELMVITDDDWIEIAKLKSLKVLDISNRKWSGNIGIISAWDGPLETLSLHNTELYGTFSWDSLYSVQKTLRHLLAYSMGNVSGNINLNVLVNATELVNFELYNNSLTGMISTDNSIPLPGNIKSFNMEGNDLSGSINWQIFRNSEHLTELKLNNNGFIDTINWEIIRYLSHNSLDILWLNNNNFNEMNADFRNISINDLRLDTTIKCDETIYCPNNWISIERTPNIIDINNPPACTCQCNDGTNALISPLCPNISPTSTITSPPTEQLNDSKRLQSFSLFIFICIIVIFVGICILCCLTIYCWISVIKSHGPASLESIFNRVLSAPMDEILFRNKNMQSNDHENLSDRISNSIHEEIKYESDNEPHSPQHKQAVPSNTYNIENNELLDDKKEQEQVIPITNLISEAKTVRIVGRHHKTPSITQEGRPN